MQKEREEGTSKRCLFALEFRNRYRRCRTQHLRCRLSCCFASRFQSPRKGVSPPDSARSRRRSLVPNGQAQLPSKPQLPRMVIRHAHLSALSQVPTYRVRYRIGGGKAVELVVGDADDLPSHGRERVRPARVFETLGLAFVRPTALIFHVQFRLRPAEVASEERLSRKRPRRRVRTHLVVHSGNAQPVAAARMRQPQHERLLRFPRRGGSVSKVRDCARYDTGTVERRVSRREVAQSPHRSEGCSLIGRG